MNCDADVMRYVGNGTAWTSPLAEFLPQQERALARAKAGNYGAVSVFARNSEEFLGLCWLAPSPHLEGETELGYRYVKAAWGHGYATEAAKAVTDVGFRNPTLTKIMGLARSENLASQHVLGKLGFRYIRDMFVEKIGFRLQVYVLERGDWDQTKGQACTTAT